MTPAEHTQATFTGVVNALLHAGIGHFLNSRQLEARLATEKTHPNPLTRQSAKYFSQNGEDGIILEIFRRLALDRQLNFIEFGVGNGLENNTLNLLVQGHRGVWVGGEELALSIPPTSTKLYYQKAWITAENACLLFDLSCEQLETEHIDLFSLDIDGVDIYVLEEMLKSGNSPTVVICEYNGKFPPPIEFQITYNPEHQHDGSDYFGASLSTFNKLLTRFGYSLIACDISGTNAFFIRNEQLHNFEDVPLDIADIFVKINFGYLYRVGHPTSPRTIEQFL